MYSPKIPDRIIPTLYRLARAEGKPMTRLVAEVLEEHLASLAYRGVLPPPPLLPPADAPATIRRRSRMPRTR